jgi:RNA polymerase sigma-70 factor (ECF subfamily)
MRLVQEGDSEALGYLFDRYSSLIEKVAFRILRDLSEAQDLVQDVFLYVHRRSHVFDPTKGALVSWLVQIAYTRAFSRRQQMKSRDAADCTRIEELANSVPANEGLERFLDELSARDLVEQALENLTEPQRKTLQLYFFEGHSLREISVSLNESLSNTRHHYYRGIDKLKEVLEVSSTISSMARDGK